jgi:hypothetical protein
MAMSYRGWVLDPGQEIEYMQSGRVSAIDRALSRQYGNPNMWYSPNGMTSGGQRWARDMAGGSPAAQTMSSMAGNQTLAGMGYPSPNQQRLGGPIRPAQPANMMSPQPKMMGGSPYGATLGQALMQAMQGMRR